MSVVYFHLIPPTLDPIYPAYQYGAICIAQGLKKLGISFYSNINYWRVDFGAGDYLFKSNEYMGFEDYDAYVFNGLQLYYNSDFRKEISRVPKGKAKILLDTCDGLYTKADRFGYQKMFDIILKIDNKGNRASNIFPWTYGLSDDLILLSETLSNEFSRRNNSILLNARHAHPVRQDGIDFIHRLARFTRIKIDDSKHSMKDGDSFNRFAEFYRMTGNRHLFSYMQRMLNSRFVSAFCGNYLLPFPFDINYITWLLGGYFIDGRHYGKGRRIIKQLNIGIKHTYNLYQWDSWRFWESMICGCVTIHVDFDKYDILMPVKPENFRHYIGVDFRDDEGSLKEFQNSSHRMEEISVQGRKWALEHYSPEPTARRFINLI